MSTAKKRWFVSNFITRIALQNVGNQEARGYGAFFDTWREAHTHLMQRLGKELDSAQRNLSAAERRHKKARLMIDPTFKI